MTSDDPGSASGDSLDSPSSYPPLDIAPPASTTGRSTWRLGDCAVSRGLVEFLVPSIALLLLTLAALVGVFKDPMWTQLLFLVARVMTPS
jgi:hypothetical protein